MKMRKYVVAMVLALICVFAVKPVEVQAAITFEEMKVTVVDDLRNYDQKVGLSWKLDWNLDKNAGVTEQKRYGKFTITEKSYVRIKMITENEKAFATHNWFRLYPNESMAVSLTDNGIDYGKGDDMFLLEPGTYYVECGTDLYTSSSSAHSTKIMIGAVPEDGAVTYSKAVSQDGKSVTITVNQKIADKLTYLKWKEGISTNETVIGYTGEALDPTTQSFTVTKNGDYTVLVETASDAAFNKCVDVFLHINVNEIGANLNKKTTYKSGNLKYKLVKAGLNGAGTVMVTGIVKQKSSVTIPKTVKLKGHSYKVVKINRNAFKGKSKIKKITIKSTYITSIGKNAIKGINKKATIKVPKSSYAAYKKLFKKSTGYVKTMKIKK